MLATYTQPAALSGNILSLFQQWNLFLRSKYVYTQQPAKKVSEKICFQKQYVAKVGRKLGKEEFSRCQSEDFRQDLFFRLSELFFYLLHWWCLPKNNNSIYF